MADICITCRGGVPYCSMACTADVLYMLAYCIIILPVRSCYNDCWTNIPLIIIPLLCWRPIRSDPWLLWSSHRAIPTIPFVGYAWSALSAPRTYMYVQTWAVISATPAVLGLLHVDLRVGRKAPSWLFRKPIKYSSQNLIVSSFFRI